MLETELISIIRQTKVTPNLNCKAGDSKHGNWKTEISWLPNKTKNQIH